MSTATEEAPAMIPTLRHSDPAFAERFANRGSVVPDERDYSAEDEFAEGNGEHKKNEDVVRERRITMSSSSIVWKIYDAVSRQRASFEPLRHSTYKETDRHAELGSVLRLADTGASPATLLSILRNSRYPITQKLANTLMDETRVQPAIAQTRPQMTVKDDLDDPEMEEYYRLLETLGYE